MPHKQHWSGLIERWRIVAVVALGTPFASQVAAPLVAAAPPQAQANSRSAGSQPVFDAASVKPAAQTAGPGGPEGSLQRKSSGAPRGVQQPDGGPGSRNPGRIHYPGVTLEFLLTQAYDANGFQIIGPAWLNFERFDIDATMPPDTTREQFRKMLQNLLTERFKLAIRRETKELSGYSLVVASTGSKVKKPAAPLAPQDDSDPAPLKPGADGYFPPPERPGIFLQLTASGGAREAFRQATMQDLANSLMSQLKRPVADATGLPDRYDFTFTFATQGLDMGSGRIPVSWGDGETPPALIDALHSQLGLRLEKKKVPVEMIVVDRVEKTPTEN